MPLISEKDSWTLMVTSDNLIGLYFPHVNSFALAYECYYPCFNFARHWPLCCIFNGLPMSFFIKHFWSTVSFDVNSRKNFACFHISELLPRNTSHQPKLQKKKGLTQLDVLLCYNTAIWGKHIRHQKGCKDIWICTACNITVLFTYCNRGLAKIWILISQKK